ncbi:fibrinogen-like YCDxxxxGGGW domain-containing protein [Nonomuraea sp. NPDC059194]|uniref:fibrinogen-like YCDxxxxGGGW domain-containing protein n=1 Tax=Nonomuraea sp. NPDC059194 TaxID=3346764 RepID=UPI0036B20868
MRLPLFALSAILLALFPATAQAAAPPPPDGTSAVTAAPSCWAIKQSYPSSPDGIYYLQTPALVAAQQFYCDMTTDGGGWVLLGRGRQGWEFGYGGQKSAGDVRNTPTGTAAFAPAAINGDTVNGLLNGGRVDALPDGVRIRRAANQAGTSWQELRWKFANRDTWSWTFDGQHALSSVKANAVTYNGGNTRDWNLNNGSLRLFTFEWNNHGWKKGFSYGSGMAGASTSASSYLWQNSTEGHPIPFTQVFIRPKLTTVSYPAIPDTGTAASTNPPLVSNATSPTPWGVTGVVGGGGGEENIEVQAMAVLGDTLFVGGEFEFVQKGANPVPADKIAQPYLAAFDVNTGEWISSFRPALNGTVWSLEAADGKVFVGGEFTSANGEADTSGLVALDPATGAVVPGWRANVVKKNAGALRVRAMDIQGEWLYVGGAFTHVKGGNPMSLELWTENAARVRLSDGRPDSTWAMHFDASVIELDATQDRVYFGGRFKELDGQPVKNVAVLQTSSPPTRVAGLNDQNWLPSQTGDPNRMYRQTILEVGDRVWMGGAEHDFQIYTRAFDRMSGNITRAGGDFQAAVEVNGIVYGSCHCGGLVWNGANTWPSPGTNWTDVNQITFIGAWDSQTGKYLPNFNPNIDARDGEGPWELVNDGKGCLWFGGDMNRGSWVNGSYQWLGGFGRLCSADATAPASPSNLRQQGAGIAWNAATDDSGIVRYEVLRDDRVIANVNSLSFTDTTASGTHRYFVRAIDNAGNRSASTPVLLVQQTETLLPLGATWKWVHDGVDQGTAWKEAGFDDSAWAAGAAELGFGDNDETTVIPAGATPRPMTAYFRTTVDVPNPSAYGDLLLDLIRDDGAVVYVNGVEVGRDNLPAGAITHSTAALAGLQTNAEERTPVRFTVPSSALVAGTNTIAVEMHQANAWSADLSFALSVAAVVN